MGYTRRQNFKEGEFTHLCLTPIKESCRTEPFKHYSYLLHMSYKISIGICITSLIWSALPKTLSDLIESVQKRALKIAYPTLSSEGALQKNNIKLLSTRREEACKKLINSLRDQNSPHNPLTPVYQTELIIMICACVIITRNYYR